MCFQRLTPAACAVLLVAAAAGAQQAPSKPAPPEPLDLRGGLTDLHLELAERAAELAAATGEMQAEFAAFGAAGELASKLAAQEVFKGYHDSEDRLYDRGRRALDNRRWEEALNCFSQVSARGGARADAGLYWKAYTLNKLGRRDEALAALAELHKSHAQSRWLADAKALEVEVKQAAGRPVKPENQDDDELKLMALNAIMETDPERAMPLLENLLKSAQSPKFKERTLFVLAQSDSPRARQTIEQVARGGAGNPDLQLKAIMLLSARGKKADSSPLLWEIYRTTSSAEVKERILHSLVAGGNFERLLEVARAEKDPKLRRTAIYSLSAMKSAQSGDSLLSLYGGESDREVKKAIINALAGQRNTGALVSLARKEGDPQMKREIVVRLAGIKSKESSDYMMELLK